MGDNGSEDNDKERVVGVEDFALLIRQIVRGGQSEIAIKSENTGIPTSDVILIVESWLEKVKDDYKKNIKDSLKFGKKK